MREFFHAYLRTPCLGASPSETILYEPSPIPYSGELMSDIIIYLYIRTHGSYTYSPTEALPFRSGFLLYDS